MLDLFAEIQTLTDKLVRDAENLVKELQGGSK